MYSPVIYMKLELNSILLVFPYDFNIFRFHIRFPLVGFPVITGPAVEVEKISDSARFFSRQNTKGGRSQFYKVTKGSTRTLIGCYANLRLRLGIAQLSRILPTRLVFISVYANTENVSLCGFGGRWFCLREVFWDQCYNSTFLLFVPSSVMILLAFLSSLR